MARAKVYDLIEPAVSHQRRSTDAPALPDHSSYLTKRLAGWQALRRNPQIWYGMEGLLTFALLALGIVVWLPFDTFGVSRTYTTLRLIMPVEAAWGAIFTLVPLYHFDRWLVQDPYRTRSLSIVIGLWLLLMTLQMLAWQPSTIWLIYPAYMYALVHSMRHLVRSWRGDP
jgi:hypothetical protein